MPGTYYLGYAKCPLSHLFYTFATIGTYWDENCEESIQRGQDQSDIH